MLRRDRRRNPKSSAVVGAMGGGRMDGIVWEFASGGALDDALKTHATRS